MADRELTRDALVAYGGVIATVAAAGLSGTAALALPFLPTFLGLADQAFRERTARRWAVWLGEYMSGEDAKDPALFEARLHAHSEKPVVQELIAESVRVIGEALADSVVPVMARLGRQYATEDRKADAFFRGTRRLLTDLAEEEFAALRVILTRAASADLPSGYEIVQLDYLPSALPDGSELLYTKATTSEQFERGLRRERASLGNVDYALRVFHLLKVNDLGVESQPEMDGTFGGRQSVVLRRDKVRRLLELMS